ncbi:kinase-like domain-containing protein, partial [Lineolata rhizophorae]
IDDRYVFRKELGSGCEGTASIYTDQTTGEEVVVKTFFGTGRNAVPDAVGEVFAWRQSMWPAEIPALLLLSGFGGKNWTAKVHESGSHGSGYVPILDYFLVTRNERNESVAPQWHLVMPLVQRGTLQSLAGRVRAENPQPPHELDLSLRPTLRRLLRTLADLHARGYCHDDVKLDNVFALSRTHWLLGDLGNVR